ncbi:MAG: alkyl hydroperoxide reductase [Bacteroidetes bacterium]|nr:alkyl hydroperoxide reductase [Bacteroidota bacterium]
MKRIHVSTTTGVILNVISILCLATQYYLLGAVFSLIAYFASIKEVSKYTSWYQFITVFASAALTGLAVELPLASFPFILVSCFAAAVGSISRIVFFRVFSYTNHSWFEPLLFLTSLAFYLIGNLSGPNDWQDWSFPAPLILFEAILAWGILKDKKQLLAHAKGGYKVQIGEPASEFQLPDQDGNLVKLSDFRGNRHLLLIFVRGDWCPGCHMMLRTYEKNNMRFKEKNVLVMAIGPDPVGVNRGMVEKLGLDFKVLSDEAQKTAMVYGVQLKEYDNDFAEKYEEGIPLPASFLVDKNGVVRYVSRPDKVGEFLNPSLIFPIVEKLDAGYVKGKEEKVVSPAKEQKVVSDASPETEALIADLKKQLSNYESIIDQANDSMIVIDIVDGKIHQSNPSAAKLLEYKKEELEKLSLFDLHPKIFRSKQNPGNSFR